MGICVHDGIAKELQKCISRCRSGDVSKSISKCISGDLSKGISRCNSGSISGGISEGLMADKNLAVSFKFYNKCVILESNPARLRFASFCYGGHDRSHGNC